MEYTGSPLPLSVHLDAKGLNGQDRGNLWCVGTASVYQDAYVHQMPGMG